MKIKSKLIALFISSLTTQISFAADFPAKGDFQQGAKIWADNCGRCHNIRSANELRDDQWITTVFHMRVRAGLTGQESRDVLTFLQGSNTNIVKTTVVTAQSNNKLSTLSGKAIYAQTCIACHGADGTGGLPGVPNFTDKNGPLSKADDVLLQHISNGFQSPGSAMAMPPKGGNPELNSADIKKSLSYIRETFGAQ
ncbi:Cytochrome c, class I [hydrothermal vent metagenome]|uniref:Cytochrome c, class I n=1 Tax=hydrothermal vent metagenome TaxID=652676 RepID=A0A3B1AEG4_9ZZZZ